MTDIELLDNLCQDCITYPCHALKSNDHCYPYTRLAEVIREAERYRWHDLQKHPNDLPTIEDYGDKVLCLTRFGEYVAVYSNLVEESKSEFVAWAGIKPFRNTK